MVSPFVLAAARCEPSPAPCWEHFASLAVVDGWFPVGEVGSAGYAPAGILGWGRNVFLLFFLLFASCLLIVGGRMRNTLLAAGLLVIVLRGGLVGPRLP